jgi:DNA invertase Pin-like site-specific DNA recombinase
MTTAIYVRVSTGNQDTKSQEADLKAWASTQTGNIVWYRDRATGTKMERPGLDAMLADVRLGKIKRVIVWRLDRLGRMARGLLNLFHELEQAKCGFLSLRDAIDLSTPSGRLLLVVLSGVAAFETEVRGERQRAGITATKIEIAAGKRKWFKNGPPRRRARKLLPERVKAIRKLVQNGTPISEVARTFGISRKSVYVALAS